MGKKIGSIGHYTMVGHTLGKGSFARVELAVHRVTKCKVRSLVRGITHIRTRNVRCGALRVA